MKKFLLTILFCLIASSGWCADRYWVGGGSSANWNATGNTNWGTASNTQDNASVPTTGDVVYFDGVGTGDSPCTINTSTATLASLNFTGYSNTVTHAVNQDINVSGSLTFSSGMTYTVNGNSAEISFSGAGTFTSAAKTIGNFYMRTGANVILADSLTSSGALFFQGGTFDLNEYDMSLYYIDSNNTSSRTWDITNSTVTITKGGQYASLISFTNLTFTVTGSTIIYTGAAPVVFGSATYNEVQFTGGGTAVFSNTNTFATLSVVGTASKTDGLQLNNNQTITGTLNVDGNSSINRVLVTSNTLGTARTITLTGATVSGSSNVDFRDITFVGSPDFSGITGGSGDCGGNTGATFTTADDWYWNGSGTRNLSDYTYWYTATNGGGSQMASTRTVLTQDTAYIDGASIDGATTIDQDLPRIPGLDFTGCAAMAFHINNLAQEIYGSLTLSSGVTLTSAFNVFLIFKGRSNAFLTSAGKSISEISVQMIGATLALVDDASIGYNVQTAYGTLDLNDYNISSTWYYNAYLTTRALKMGSGTYTITGYWNPGTTAVDIDAETSTLRFYHTTGAMNFYGTALTYNNVTIEAGTGLLTIQGSNVINTLTINAPKTVKFTDGTTQTVSSLVAVGTDGNLITLTGTSTAGWTISDTTGTNAVEYCDISYSTAEGGATWNAYTTNGNVDSGNNSGWVFTDPGSGEPAYSSRGIGRGIMRGIMR